MTHLRVIAPMPIDFALVPGVADLDQRGYANFWISAQSAVAAASGATVELHHAKLASSTTRYTTLDADALDRPVELLTVHLDVPDLGGVDGPTVADAQVRVYARGIATLEATIETKAPPQRGAEDWLDALQARAVELASELAQESDQVVSAVLEATRRADRRGEFVEPQMAGGAVLGDPMWVSRALLVDTKHRQVLAHWTKDAVSGEGAAQREALLGGEADSLMLWLNYAFVDTAREGSAAWSSGAHTEDWHALRYAQVAYATLDQVDSQLGVVLAQAAGAHSRWDLEELQSTLVRLSRRAELAIMQRQSLEKYMSRRVRRAYDALLQAWDYSTLVEAPVRFKITLCQGRLDDLLAKGTARSSLVTDLILLGIGITSIASTALALTEFGRNAATDPNATDLDLGASAFTSWFAAQPIDVVLLASTATSAVLIVLYIYFRRDSQN